MASPDLCKKLALALVTLVGADAAAQEDADLLSLSIEELANVRITSVARVEQNLRTAPAAVYVITREEIQRSGVTSIAEALRLAPGVEVARRSSHAWSITIRGFNSDLANKLLVLVDGRSVYSPLYAGVFWDVQDVLLEDVDRIEVVSGPGGTMWGANAVNGVINVITRSAADTIGGFAELGGGGEENGFAGLRYGGTIGEGVAARTHVEYSDRESSKRRSGADGVDAFRMARAGFRVDWESERADRFTVQGDLYGGDKDGEFLEPFTLGTLPAGSVRDTVDMRGGNVLARWDRALTEGGITLQAYYDYTSRDIPNTYGEKRDTFDLDFQHRFLAGSRHDLLWGVGYRVTSDELDNTLFATFTPAERRDRRWSAFLQDEIDLKDEKLYLTLGAKVESNDYTGSEVQPSARLSWLVNSRQTFWSAVSRAVRIPSRLDADLVLTVPLSVPTIPFPVYVRVEGTDDFDSEELVAYETGYRFQASDSLSFDFTLFRNDYDRLQTSEPQLPVILPDPQVPYAFLPNAFGNLMEGEARGGTFSANWQAARSLRLRFHYSYLDLDLRLKQGSLHAAATSIEGDSPRHQAAVHAFVSLPHDLRLYSGIRYVDELPNQGIDDYTAVDVNLGWAPRGNLDVSLTVQNVNDDRHAEFSSGGGNEIERSAFVKIDWSF